MDNKNLKDKLPLSLKAHQPSKGVYKKLNPQLTSAQAQYLRNYHEWMRNSDSPETRAEVISVPNYSFSKSSAIYNKLP
jgi:hypothetical protein